MANFEDYDLDKDGKISDLEIEKRRSILEIEKFSRMMKTRDQKQNAQRRMTWFALLGMILYPVLVILAVLFGLTDAAAILGDMAGVYFVSVAGIVAAFFGAQAYTDRTDVDMRNRYTEDG
jgi:fatty acid desaturase